VGPPVIALVLNVGSSSLKAALFDGDNELERLMVTDANHAADHGVAEIVERVASSGHPPPDVIGHRLVHGGTEFTEPTIIDSRTRDALDALVALAPLHLPPALRTIDAAAKRFPDVPQVACFDTAFHATLPVVAYDLGLPSSLSKQGIRRYGFHGINCEHVVQSIGAEELGRAVIAHLGNGCSLTAVQNGKSVDTTMGFTPTGGVPMSTRSGDIDPGVLVHLLRNGYDVDAIERLTTHESGVIGWSHGEADMRALLASTEPHNMFAVAAFCHHIAKAVAALTVSLGGIETLVFTGGIGEHAEPIRQNILQLLSHLQPFDVQVVPANEEAVIARHATTTLGTKHDTAREDGHDG
jgi:acetate kinase